MTTQLPVPAVPVEEATWSDIAQFTVHVSEKPSIGGINASEQEIADWYTKMQRIADSFLKDYGMTLFYTNGQNTLGEKSPRVEFLVPFGKNGMPIRFATAWMCERKGFTVGPKIEFNQYATVPGDVLAKKFRQAFEQSCAKKTQKKETK